MMRRLTARAAQVKSLEVEGLELEGLWENMGKPIEIDDLGIHPFMESLTYMDTYIHTCMHV